VLVVLVLRNLHADAKVLMERRKISTGAFSTRNFVSLANPELHPIVTVLVRDGSQGVHEDPYALCASPFLHMNLPTNQKNTHILANFRTLNLPTVPLMMSVPGVVEMWDKVQGSVSCYQGITSLVHEARNHPRACGAGQSGNLLGQTRAGKKATKDKNFALPVAVFYLVQNKRHRDEDYRYQLVDYLFPYS